MLLGRGKEGAHSRFPMVFYPFPNSHEPNCFNLVPGEYQFLNHGHFWPQFPIMARKKPRSQFLKKSFPPSFQETTVKIICISSFLLLNLSIDSWKKLYEAVSPQPTILLIVYYFVIDFEPKLRLLWAIHHFFLCRVSLSN